jgi:hypothetical protein
LKIDFFGPFALSKAPTHAPENPIASFWLGLGAQLLLQKILSRSPAYENRKKEWSAPLAVDIYQAWN